MPVIDAMEALTMQRNCFL
ncbi:unnamed protein product [Victoria cruziana]